MDTPQLYALSNGLRLIHKQCQGEVACCGFAIKAGTRDEDPDESGIAHFTEHLLFKGTVRRKPFQIINMMERVGGELNAYTTKEETLYISIFLKKDYRRAIELLTDICFNPVFPPAEIDKERMVVLEEINSYEDNPSELIFDDFDQFLLEGHPLGRPILGTAVSLATFSADTLRQFHQRHYVLGNMVFFSQADLPLKQVSSCLDHFLAERIDTLSTTPAAAVNKSPTLLPPFYRTILKETHQAHVVTGHLGYSIRDERKLGLYLLNNLLGGPAMNSWLNLSLRERKGLAYTVESNVTFYSDTSVFSIYFGTEPEKIDRCLRVIYKELKMLCEHKLTGLQLDRAKKQFLGQLLINAENKEQQALLMGRSLLQLGGWVSLEEWRKKLECLTPEELRDIANEVMSPDQLGVLIYR
jgi:predicted Zn-dependent peptidase